MGNSKSRIVVEDADDAPVDPLFDNPNSEYPHRLRKMQYRSEQLEITPTEKATIDQWLAASIQHQNESTDDRNDHAWQYTRVRRVPTVVRILIPYLGQPVKLIFDTDIGTDIDDALALLMLLHLPREDVQLLGVTTVYGFTQIRAAVARQIIDAYLDGQRSSSEAALDIPVVAGESIPLGTHRNVWHTGTEGIGLFDTETLERMKAQQLQTNKTPHHAGYRPPAAEFILSSAERYPGELVIVALGALTNIAQCLQIDPTFPTKVRRVVYMGMGHKMREPQGSPFTFHPPSEPFVPGRVVSHYPNHNISSDTLAAVKVFSSALRIDVINDAVTNELWWDGQPCAALRTATAPPESRVVGQLLRVWLDYRSSIFFQKITGTCPHDALTVAEAVYPGRFVTYVRGHLMVHEWAGFSSFVLDPKGPHRIGLSVAAKDFLAWLSDQLLQGIPMPLKENAVEVKTP